MVKFNLFLDSVICNYKYNLQRYKLFKKYIYRLVIIFLQNHTFLYKFEIFRSLEYNVNKDLSLNNNSTNIEVQNNEVFRCQEEPLNKKIWLMSTDIWRKWERRALDYEKQWKQAGPAHQYPWTILQLRKNIVLNLWNKAQVQRKNLV